jgi:hypothetical protein
MLLTIDFDEHFIDIEGIAVATVLSSQSSNVNCSEFNAPQPDRFCANGDVSLSQKVLNIAVTEIEAIIEPDGITDDVRWESVLEPRPAISSGRGYRL